MTCSTCGHVNEEGANFCSACGASQGEDETTLSYTVPAGEDPPAVAVEPEPHYAVLEVLNGAKRGSRFSLTDQTTTAGRHPESLIFLDDVTVSRRHAVIERTDERYVVRDVGSLNGSYLNRERVDEAVLSDGDELQIGKFKLIFVGPQSDG